MRVLKVIDLDDPAHAHHRVRFPGARQAFLIERYRHFPDGTMTAAAILGITSLPPTRPDPPNSPISSAATGTSRCSTTSAT